MFNCADDIIGYHNDEVTLPQSERNAMKDRRNANRDRLKNGLKSDNKPAPFEFKSQGSYAMKTMTQHSDNNYDIDDGVYFHKEKLVGPRGAELSALDVRQMVRGALDDGSFKTAPEVRTNCVRVLYDAGYHVDVPAYRQVIGKDIFGNEDIYYELASANWKRSDARDVTAWFETENNQQSPDTSNGRQLRRITRLIKKFAKSRSSWESSILSGFGITKLVTECFRKSSTREDQSLYDTMVAIRDRLQWNLVVKHPVTPNETITTGNEDPKAKFLREKLTDAINWLKPLMEHDCTQEKALKCWDTVFSTKYFTNRLPKNESKAAAVSGGVLTSGLLNEVAISSGAPQAVRKEGGGRYA